MRSLIYIFFVLTISKELNAQNIFPSFADQPKWNVYSKSWTWYVTDKIKYAYDTVFCGQKYSKVIDTSGFSYGYIRRTGEQVFLRLNTDCKKEEVTLYDFSLKAGDTVLCGIYPGTATKFWLNQVDTVNYFGVKRVRFKMKYDLGSIETMFWIKGIGSSVHPFYSSVCLTDNCEMEYKLLCYHSADTLLFQNPLFSGCDITNVGVQEKDPDIFSLNISPNPFRSETVVSIKPKRLENIQIDLYNFSGKKLNSVESNDTKVEFTFGEHLPCGIYFIKVSLGEKFISKKIVKIE